MTPHKVMIDIETMSTDNTNALVLSVGAVTWRWSKSTEFDVLFITSRLWVMNPFEQFALGRQTDASTVAWWRNQTPEARAHWLGATKTITIAEMAEGLNGLVKEGAPDETEVWANGILFDLGNIAAMYAQAGIGPVPWKYNAAMDARSIYRQTPKLRDRPFVPDIGAAHDPIADCKNQIWGLWEHTPPEDLPIECRVLSDAMPT